MNEVKEFSLLFIYLFVWVTHLSSPQTRPWQPTHGSIISGGHAVGPSHGLQYGHTNWYGGHTTVKLGTCHVSEIFCALTAADLWRVVRGWITQSGDSVLRRGDRVQINLWGPAKGSDKPLGPSQTHIQCMRAFFPGGKVAGGGGHSI